MGCFRSSDGLHFNPLWHTISILLNLIALILLMVVILYNAPLDHVHSTLEGKVGLRMWLMTVNETNGPLNFDSPLGAGAVDSQSKRDHFTATTTQSPTNDSKSTEIEEVMKSSGGVSERAETDSNPVIAPGTQLHAYGFGIWGWCEWSNTNWQGDARCTKKAVWKLPKDADGNWDAVNRIDWPNAIRSALSGVSFMLVFIPLMALTRLFILIFVIRFPGPYPPLSIPWQYSNLPPEVRRSWQTTAAWMSRNWKWQLVTFIIHMAFFLPTIVTVLIAKGEVNDTYSGTQLIGGGGLDAKLGNGFSVLVGAWVCMVLSQILCVWKTGLVMRREGKKRSKKSKG
ncbi:hypothetical protein CI109_107349 [Kwoniella shandongensis]|uniref:Uncharacterized protein n=1 Tax=Kwoniella shandongensis TaxID=1734106 RepID=A0A5M6BVQ6_9TREE|nr:uncharacterized protein CI109_004723 [Kwoniella shandongensis]KAA5526946.1 hypothetical protein CI109_004723 [Kwoniella shandongensis]